MGRGWAGAAVALTLLVACAGCSDPAPDPERAGTVVVAIDQPLGSLNAAVGAGRTPGSTLVRGLVQGGFVSLSDAGEAVFDASFGTVEKVSDSPLTVKYTIEASATWSDGVSVTPADLLLEWAARSGQYDEVVPGLAADGTLAQTSTLDGVVAFAATSPALVHAPAVPTIDGATLTLVYDQPVADWALALDVNLPAHVVGRLALDPTTATPSPAASSADTATSPAATSSDTAAASPAPTTDAGWADLVTAAITGQQRDALVAISRVWRTGFDTDQLAADPGRAVTTGPYRIRTVSEDRAELVASSAYRGEGKPRYDEIVLRTDLAPLDEVDALKAGTVDVAVPVTADDVRDALDALAERVVVTHGDDAVLQLQLQEGSGLFAASSYTADGSDGTAAAAAARTAFLATVPRQALADLADAQVSDLVLPQAGSARPAEVISVPAAGDAAGGVVRLLVNDADPVRAAMVDALKGAAADAGFAIVVVQTDDLAASYWSHPDTWDAALVPATPEELPVASVVARWRTGGATNATAHSDAALDAALDPLATTLDPAAVGAALTQVSSSLVSSGAVLPLVRQTVLVATAAHPAADADRFPSVAAVPALAWTAADQTAWWSWARR